ncbi:MAG TPA: selenocysteine-specific translation elongation factor [Planctomycetota bacterium]|nr:selenocysteine-specific translation elongation factor [Planctomycetota bacterium]
MASPGILRLTLGTAGHIDHGKTSLVRALVGGDAETDRLKEEKARGLTIEVGYAEWRLPDGVEVGIVDVPGHEKFVRNMVSGASGMDCVLLVVAADDGAMPQTREHLQIMSLLGIRAGAVALTKIDLVDPEMRELVAEDLKGLLRGTFLEGAPFFPVSSTTGAGIPELRAGLERILRAAPPRDAAGPFRMPIQRVFTVKGHGTVATGIPISGTARRDDRLELLPAGKPCRVRGIQVYHRDAVEAAAGHRAALNLADLDWHAVGRGDVLAEPGLFRASTLFDVRFRRSPGEHGAIPHRFPILFLTGTAEAPGRLLLLEGDAVEPGEEALAQVALDEPVVAAPGDRFILRTPSPAATAGGGVVLGIAARRRHRKRATSLDPIREAESALGDVRASARAALRAAGAAGATDATLAPAIQRRPAETRAVLADLVAAGEAVPLPGGLHLAAAAWEEVRTAVLRALEEFHGKNRLREAARPAELRAALRAPEAVVDAAARALAGEGRAELLPGGRVRLEGRGAAPTDAEAGHLARLAEALREAKFATPREDELPSLLGVPAALAEALLGLLVERGEALRLKDGVVLHAAVAEEGRNAVAERIRTAGGIQPAELKELLGATRKYSIPFLEHLDSSGVTLRVGDKRVLRKS